MSVRQTERDRLWRLIEDAQVEVDHEKANALFHDAERLGCQLNDREPNEPEHCYAVALTYYHRWDTPSERRKCVGWLHKADQRQPSLPWVPLYLGYQFFDDGRYPDALAEFARVDQSYFASIDHHWRNLKTDELMLVALVRGYSSVIDFSRLVGLAQRYADAEVVDRPVPIEIVKTLATAENRERFTAPGQNVAAEVCRLIHACGDTNVFPDELAVLEAASKVVG